MTASFSVALPPLGGYWLDQRLGTHFVFLALGMLFGLAAGGWQLYQITLSLERSERPQKPRKPNG